MCLSHLIEIVPTFHSTGTVPQHHPSARRITYSSQKLRALNHVNQVGKQIAGRNPKSHPSNAIATIRKLRIIESQSGQDMTDLNGINKRE